VGVHSYVWWKGVQGSAGYIRVLATIVPLVSLVSLLAFSKLSDYFIKITRFSSDKSIKAGFIIIGGFLVYNSATNLQVDNRLLIEQEVLKEVAEW
jgi:hypothetical protein